MKKAIALFLVALLVFSFAACGADNGKKAENGDNTKAEGAADSEPDAVIDTPIDGGYSDVESVEVNDQVREIVEKATQTQVGATYSPVAYLAIQVVAGSNHLILCKVAPVVAEPTYRYALVTIYEDLDGNAEITAVNESDAVAPAPYDEDNPVAGAYGEPESVEVTADAKDALEKATETLTGAVYKPVALLATQVVAGMNYKLLCKVSPSVEEVSNTTHYVIVTVYQDLDGNATITETYEFGATEEGAPQSASSQAE